MERQEKFNGILTEIVTKVYEVGRLGGTRLRITGEDERDYWIFFYGDVPQEFVGKRVNYSEINISTWCGARMETWQRIVRVDEKGNNISPNINAHRVAWGPNR
jgi:hypothetical protein